MAKRSVQNKFVQNLQYTAEMCSRKTHNTSCKITTRQPNCGEWYSTAFQVSPSQKVFPHITRIDISPTHTCLWKHSHHELPICNCRWATWIKCKHKGNGARICPLKQTEILNTTENAISQDLCDVRNRKKHTRFKKPITRPNNSWQEIFDSYKSDWASSKSSFNQP